MSVDNKALIVEYWAVGDVARVLQQIGVLPQKWTAPIANLNVPTPKKTEPANQALGVGRRELGISKSTVQKSSA